MAISKNFGTVTLLPQGASRGTRKGRGSKKAWQQKDVAARRPTEKGICEAALDQVRRLDDVNQP
jgi:hypothetical protein